MKHLRETKPRPQEIVYPEDRVRRQFFKDFPFEALRPTSLVEGQDLRDEGAKRSVPHGGKVCCTRAGASVSSVTDGMLMPSQQYHRFRSQLA
jgi:hypothetical protein